MERQAPPLQVFEKPPFWSRLGCGLSVATMLLVCSVCIGLFLLFISWYDLALNIYLAGPERFPNLIDAVVKTVFSEEYRSKLTIGLAVVFGITLAGFFIGSVEAANFLTWFKRR